MNLYTSTYDKTLNVGTGDIWFSIYSTVLIRLPKELQEEIPNAVEFLRTGECLAKDAVKTARQINLIRDGLSQVRPEEAVYRKDDLNAPAPWASNISPVVTSCANLYLTSDGKDILYEVVSLLCYAAATNQNIQPE